MKNILSKSFRSHLSVDEMLARLKTETPSIDWVIRDSEYDDRYVRGMTPDGIKIRIVDYDQHYSLEVYFPTGAVFPRLEDKQKKSFMARVSDELFPLISATDVADED